MRLFNIILISMHIDEQEGGKKPSRKEKRMEYMSLSHLTRVIDSGQSFPATLRLKKLD